MTLTQPETYTCDREGCEQEFTPAGAVEGSYCSQTCAALVAGSALIGHIRDDHRFCHGCFDQVKEIERVEKQPIVGPVEHDAGTLRDCIIGFEHLTEHAELGEREDGHYVLDEDDADERVPAKDAAVTGAVCSCGTTGHRDPYLREQRITSLNDAARRFCEIVAMLRREAQHDKTIDAEALLVELDSGEEMDWAESVRPGDPVMSTQQVQASILGQIVTGEIVARHPTADYGDGPRDEFVLDVGGARYRVDEDDLEAA